MATDGRLGGVCVGRVLQLGAGRWEAAGATNGVALGALPAFAALLTLVLWLRVHLMRIRGTNTGTLASMLGKKPGLAFARVGGVAVQARHALTPLLPHTQAAR